MMNFLGQTSKLQQFKNKSANAISLFTKTLTDLTTLSKEIEEEETKTEAEIAEQNAYLAKLNEEKLTTGRIIGKIESIIS